jgi:hypothetical protein
VAVQDSEIESTLPADVDREELVSAADAVRYLGALLARL